MIEDLPVPVYNCREIPEDIKMKPTQPLRFTLLFLAIILSFSCSSVFAQPVAPIKANQDGQYGFIDASGTLVIPAQFEDARNFSQGLAPVFNEGAWFFIDQSGRNPFSLKFDEAKEFKEGLAAVRNNDLWGYIDLEGKLAIACQFEEAFSFAEGLACVQTGKKSDGSAKYGYVDKAGKFIIAPELKFYDNQFFSHPTEFSEGLASAWLEKKDGTCKVGYIDKTGKIVIPPGFIEGGKFSEGLAPVNTSDSLEAGGRYIKKDGTFAFAREFSRTGAFSSGLAPVSVTASDTELTSWGYINKLGQLAIPAAFTYAETFKNGIARVYLEDFSNEAYIDHKGTILCSTQSLIETGQSQIIKPLSPDGVISSSFLAPSRSGKTDYKPENINDGERNTAWIEGAEGNGVGEWIELLYEGKCNFKKIGFLNGYQKKNINGVSLFKRNLRPAKIRISNEEGSFVEVELKDIEEKQTFSINLSGHNLRITILSVHKHGDEDLDCGFSEIFVSGNF